MSVKQGEKFMAQALKLAAKGRGITSPNPMVGAVIVKSGKIVSQGYHKGHGHDHAEIAALKKAGARARGATMYVTLEPCCHTGRTGPCTAAILEAGIARVVFALRDPDKRVNGKGERILRAAGIDVVAGAMAREAELLNEYYLTSQRLNRPFVILKLAQSLDGRIATATGDSKWISGEESRAIVHQMRSEVDAVLIGAGTARKDDPLLSVRMIKGRNPYRIILEGRRRLPADLQLIVKNADNRTIVGISSSSTFTGPKNSALSTTAWRVPADRGGRPRLKGILMTAHRFGIRSIMIEGGSAVATGFLKQRLVDKVVLFMAPILIGDGVNAVGDLAVKRVMNAIRFARQTTSVVGQDVMFVGYPEWAR